MTFLRHIPDRPEFQFCKQARSSTARAQTGKPAWTLWLYLSWRNCGREVFHGATGGLPGQPLAGIFPPMTEGEYARLEESIREVGLLEEITLWRGTVVDGVHRLRACLRLGIEPRFSCLPDDADPLEYVTGKNGSRRDLAPWQRPIAAFRASKSSRWTSPQFRGKLRNFLPPG